MYGQNMKKLLITGGRGDIGQAIIAEFQKQEYEVLAPQHAQLDLSVSDEIDNYIKNITEVDVLVYCAGINYPKPFINIEDEDLEKTLMVNAVGFYKTTQALIKYEKLHEKGHILGISSIYGEISRKGRFSYTASKYCLNGMIKNLALELGRKQVKVNGLAPGFVNSELTRKNNSQETINRLERSIPLGFMARPEEIAKAAYFLCSPDNSYITGQIITADGGYLAGGFQE